MSPALFDPSGGQGHLKSPERVLGGGSQDGSWGRPSLPRLSKDRPCNPPIVLHPGRHPHPGKRVAQGSRTPVSGQGSGDINQLV